MPWVDGNNLHVRYTCSGWNDIICAGVCVWRLGTGYLHIGFRKLEEKTYRKTNGMYL
jgi:hypothetical protein